MNQTPVEIALLIGSYLLGSLPFGLWLGRACCHVDLRTCGSGNIGATNAWRVLGWKVGLPVFVLDLCKGLVPVLLAKTSIVEPMYSLAVGGHVPPDAVHKPWYVVGCGLAAILGHNFSPFLGFKGGKGVATTLGVAIGLSWKAALAGFVVWALLLATLQYMSIASLVGTPVGSLGIWLDNGRTLPYALFALLATVFVVVKHKSNIQRLRSGTEPKFQLRHK